MQGNDRDAECKPDRGPGAESSPRFDDGMVNLHELVRALAEVLVNQIVDAVVDQLCAGGTNSRNGYRERRLETCAGTITMRIPPKLRTGSFFPDDIVERCQRVDRAFVAAMAVMYATGASTRKVARVAETFPSVESLERLAGAVMCDEDEEWSRARYFSEAKMA